MYEQISSNKRRTVFLLLFFLVILWALGYLIGKATGNPGLLFFFGIYFNRPRIFSPACETLPAPSVTIPPDTV